MVELARRAVNAFRELTFRHREYSIGIFTGPSPFALAPARGASNPVISRDTVSDASAAFAADPFMLRVDGRWHMFFEILVVNGELRRGEIAHATSPDGLRWDYQGTVLREPFHMSYPYVFQAGSDIYMIPETSKAGAVRLYRADPFPSQWKFIATLLNGPVLLDTSVFERDGRWWMFTQTAAHSRHDTLRLYSASDVFGPWVEHPRSPVVSGDPRVARPAGRILLLPDRIIRFAQDCRGDYGMRVHAITVERLTADEYGESEHPDNPFLEGSGRSWNRSGMHHVDAHQLPDGSWIACVDGWTNRLWQP